MTPSPPDWVFTRAQEQAWLGVTLTDTIEDLRVLGATAHDAAYVLVAPAPLGHGLTDISDIMLTAGYTPDDLRALLAEPIRFINFRWDNRYKPITIPAGWVEAESPE